MSAEAKIESSRFAHRPDLLVCLQRDCNCLLETLELLYADKLSLSKVEVGDLYASLRYGGVSFRQLDAAIGKVCSSTGESGSAITKHELAILLPELDRRYFIIQGAQWEFALLDRQWKGEISEKDALFLFKSVHGCRFVMQSWETFVRGRAKHGSKVTWEEIEVPLCDIPDEYDFQQLKEREAKAKEERLLREKELAKKRQERLVREREKRFQLAREQERAREREEQLARETEEQLIREREERLAAEEQQRQGSGEGECDPDWVGQRPAGRPASVGGLDQDRPGWAMPEERMKEISVDETVGGEEGETADGASEPEEVRSTDEQRTEEGINKVPEEATGGSGPRETVEDENHRKLRLRLERAVRSKDVAELEPAVEAVKKEKVPNCSELLNEAEKLLKKLQATKNLHDATISRQLAALEQAIGAVKKGGWEKDLQREMQEATALLEKLRRLEQRKKAVLELSQRVIAELKSYSNPPPQVHQVMRATFLLLGNSEKETKSWPATQVLIGKTGKGSLKRRVAECNAEAIALPVAKRALVLLQEFDFITIQETSLGCATFHAWAEGIIEEVLERKHDQEQ